MGLRRILRRLRDRATGTGAVAARVDALKATLDRQTGHVEALGLQVSRLDGALGVQADRIEALLTRLDVTARADQGASVARRIADRPKDAPVRIAFLFQMPEIWSSWQSVWEALAADPRAEVKMVSLPFYHEVNGAQDKARAFLAERDIPFVDVSAYDLEVEAPDVVFFQNPYDSTRPEAYSAQRLAALGIRIAYVPYGLEVGGGAENLRWQYDLDVQRLAWRVFVRAPRHRRMFARYCRSGSAHVCATGHPKLDRFSEGVMTSRQGALADALGERRAVLWTPHFSVEEGGWSTYRMYGETVLSAFEQRADLALIVRPHPIFFARMHSLGLFDEAGEAAFRARLKASGNILLDESADYAEAFACSEALIADAGSFLLEYLPTGKPVLYLAQPSGPGLNEEGAVVQGYYQAESDADILAFIESVARGEDPMRAQRLAQIEEFFSALDGQAGARIAAHVIDAVRSERHPVPGLAEGGTCATV